MKKSKGYSDHLELVIKQNDHILIDTKSKDIKTLDATWKMVKRKFA